MDGSNPSVLKGLGGAAYTPSSYRVLVTEESVFKDPDRFAIMPLASVDSREFKLHIGATDELHFVFDVAQGAKVIGRGDVMTRGREGLDARYQELLSMVRLPKGREAILELAANPELPLVVLPPAAVEGLFDNIH